MADAEEQDRMEEEALVEAARRDAGAFSALYRRYLPPLYRFFYSRVNSRDEAEDLTTQVFLEALEGLVQGRYRQGGCFPAWLFTIARRRLVDFYRRRNPDILQDMPSDEAPVSIQVEQRETLHQLDLLLKTIEEDQQELLALRYAAGLSFKEMGLLLGRTEAAVKMAFYRTLSFLRDHWEERDE